MKNVLITGGAGFIGSNLAKKLLRLGYRVTILDNLSKQIHGDNPEVTSPIYRSLLNTDVRIIIGSITDKDILRQAIEGQDIIVHYAAETGTGQSMYEIEKYIDVNIGGTALMLDILTNEKHEVIKLIVASSRAIYGEGSYMCKKDGLVFPDLRRMEDIDVGDFECKCPICGSDVDLKMTNEDAKIHPNSIYGITKQNQEQMIMLMGKTLGIPAVALRYQNVYGPGQSLSNPYTGILSIFSNLIRNGKNINIFEDGNESRDFVYIDDVVDATILSIESDNANNKIYNVGSNERLNVKQVAETLIKAYKSNSKLEVSGNYRLGDIRHNIADISRIQTDLGYKPKFSFNIGIKRFVEWVKTQEIKSDAAFEDSISEMKDKGLFK